MGFQALSHLDSNQLYLLMGALALAFGFEVVNGFHDTANAVATVIYTRSMRPSFAVVWSGLCNMLGILLGGIGVAFSIVHLLPVDLLAHINTNMGQAMVLSLLGAALIWNFGTWYLGLPASSSHALIGSILGVGLAHSWLNNRPFFSGVNQGKFLEVSLSLLVSPLIGFGLSAILLVWARRLHPSKELHEAPTHGSKPPWWVRTILVTTCTGVSFAHGSNDGQKGMGLVMLILIGLVPAQFALNLQANDSATRVYQSVVKLDNFVNQKAAGYVPAHHWWMAVADAEPTQLSSFEDANLQKGLNVLRSQLAHRSSLSEIPDSERWNLRRQIMAVEHDLTIFEKKVGSQISVAEQKTLSDLHDDLRQSIEYVPRWVMIAVALALGLGTMIGWKRVAVTIGEKIGKSHLTYSQGASAEIVAMSTIGLADIIGLPVSTTHVLSSGVAGTMWANRSGVNLRTVRSIALAWLFTLPASMLLSAGLLMVSRWVLS